MTELALVKLVLCANVGLIRVQISITAALVLPAALVGNGPDHRTDCQQRADHWLHIGSLDVALGDECRPSDGQDLADERQDCRFQHSGLLFSVH